MTTIALGRFSAPLGQFIHWWLGELRSCVPARLRSGFGRQQQTLVVGMESERAVFELWKTGVARNIGHIDLGQTATVRSELAKIRRRINPRRTEIVLCFPHDRLLRRQVNLPLAATENLREVLMFEMDRHTPFQPGEVYFDYRLLHTDVAAKRISVDLAAIPRATADEAIRLLQEWNLAPDRVSVVQNDPTTREAMSLLPPDTKSQRGRLGRRLTVFFASIAGTLSVAAVGLEYHRQTALLAIYQSAVEESHARGLAAESVKKQVAGLLEQSRHVALQKRNQHRVVEILAEVTRLLPDNSWISQLRLQGDQLVLSGYSPAASVLIGPLEDSPMLAQVHFASPVTIDPKLGVERFDLSASIVNAGGGQ
jgi:general secretion pathway protein L